MLPSLKFEGTARVINKGVDVTLLTDEKGSGDAFWVSRYLVVKGISAAVLSVTQLDPVDMRTIRYYEETTGVLIFLKKDVYDAVRTQLLKKTRAVLLEEEQSDRLPGEIARIAGR